MQNTSFQRSILRTILHFTLFYAMAAGCGWWKSCKGASVDKSTNINIVPSSKEKEKDLKQPDPDDATKESLDVGGKEKEEDEDIKKKIEKELVAEQKRLEEEQRILKEEEEKKEELGKLDPVQSTPSYDHSYSVEPSAPKFEDNPNFDPPPPYTTNEQDNNPSTNSSSMPTSSNECENCRKGNNRTFDEEDIKNLRNNLSTKKKIAKALEVINILRDNVMLYWKTKNIYIFKDKLSTLQNQKIDLEKEQNEISSNPMLCSSHKAKKLKYNFIKIENIDYNKEQLERIITKIRKKDESTNKETPQYPAQPWGEALNGTINPGPSAPIYDPKNATNPNEPPPYSSSNATAPTLYPSLNDFRKIL